MEIERRDIRETIFRYRSYTPLPFLAVMLWFARPSTASLAVGFGVALVGEAIRFWGVSIAGSETRTTGKVGGTSLITSGPFAYVRNPLYLGNILVYVGVGIMSMALFPWLPIFAVLWFFLQYYLIVTKEEEYLTERFGAAYAEYKASVGRFFPRFKRYPGATLPRKRVDFREGISSERRTFQALSLITVVLVAIYLFRRSTG
jgi:protein-S-isoprenylcysteine O-methyltransferase Ste14